MKQVRYTYLDFLGSREYQIWSRFKAADCSKVKQQKGTKMTFEEECNENLEDSSSGDYK